MKQFKKQWEEQLNQVVPNLRQDVLDEPIPAKTTKSLWQTVGNFVAGNKRSFAVATSFCLVLVLAVVAFLPVLAPTQQTFATAVMVEVNPSATFSVNKQGFVTNVVATNADADVLLSNGNVVEQLKGVPAEQAVQTFVDYCAQLGYLDLSTQNAIRVTTCENGNHNVVDKISTAMTCYFQQKGALVAVVGESVDAQTFANRAGLSATKSLQKLVENVQTLATTYSSRAQEVQTLYSQVVSFNDVSTVILQAVQNKSEEVDLRLQQLAKIQNLSDQILQHSDNQYFLVLSLDYWTIVNGNLEIAQGEFADLMQQMASELENYKQTFSDEVESKQGMEKKIRVYEFLQSSLDVTLDFVQENLEFIQSLFPNDETMAKLFDLFQLPQNLSEYLSKLSNYYASRLEMYQHKFNQMQQAISAEQYQTFVDQVVAQYGSLANYWNTLNN